MKHPTALVASLLLAASGLHAQPEEVAEIPDTSRISAEIALRMGSIFGQVLDEESSNYDGVGLKLIDKNAHDTTSIDPVGSAVGLDACVLYRISPRIEAGIAFVMQSTDVQPSKTTSNDLSAALFEEQAILARLRIKAFSYRKFRFGAEAGVGRSSGILHRFALSQKNIETIKAGILASTDPNLNKSLLAENLGNDVALGAKDLEVSGLRYEAAVMVVRPFSSHLALDARLGFHHTTLKPNDTDPLNAYAKQVGFPEYPSSVSAIGIDFAIGLLASF